MLTSSESELDGIAVYSRWWAEKFLDEEKLTWLWDDQYNDLMK